MKFVKQGLRGIATGWALQLQQYCNDFFEKVHPDQGHKGQRKLVDRRARRQWIVSTLVGHRLEIMETCWRKELRN